MDCTVPGICAPRVSLNELADRLLPDSRATSVMPTRFVLNEATQTSDLSSFLSLSLGTPYRGSYHASHSPMMVLGRRKVTISGSLGELGGWTDKITSRKRILFRYPP